MVKKNNDSQSKSTSSSKRADDEAKLLDDSSMDLDNFEAISRRRALIAPALISTEFLESKILIEKDKFEPEFYEKFSEISNESSVILLEFLIKDSMAKKDMAGSHFYTVKSITEKTPLSRMAIKRAMDKLALLDLVYFETKNLEYNKRKVHHKAIYSDQMKRHIKKSHLKYYGSTK